MTMKPQNDVALRVHDLKVALKVPGGMLPAVRGVSFELERGRTLGIVGESGSGKSVTARALMGLFPKGRSIMSGSVEIGGREILNSDARVIRHVRGEEMGMVFQDPTRSLNPTMRVGTQIVEAIRAHSDISRSAARNRAVELLSMVGIPHARERAHAYPHQLSGGMRQRIVLAIAISCQPSILIADEPTTALDVTTQLQIMELIGRLQDEYQMALILITHDMDLASSYVDDVAVMYAGRIVERGPVRKVLSSVRMPYTKGLLDATLQDDTPPHSHLYVLPGRPPDPRSLTAGCPFAPRCDRVKESCFQHEPELLSNDDEHASACWFPIEEESV